jgi:tripartite-type tricarboxylate transporter receptor subunit TctC
MLRIYSVPALAALLLPAAPGVAAQDYPARPIRLIVPVAAGGGNDIAARMIAHKLTEAWGQQVVVDNRPGAATAIGSELTARASPDGYTIMLVSVSFAVNAAMHPKLPYDPLRDFAPITQVARVPQILLVHPAVPAKSVTELIALAKAKPGALNYASAGTGSSTHLPMELFMSLAHISFNHVPYKGTAPGLTDLLAGQVQLMFNAIPPALPHMKSGRVRALAVTSAQRSASLPEVPTIAESGLPGYAYDSWFAIFAPARTPAAIIDKLNREIVRIVKLPDVHERFVTMGVDPLGTSPRELGQHVKSEIARFTKIVRDRNIRAE